MAVIEDFDETQMAWTRGLSWTAMAIALISLGGWILGATRLAGLVPGFATMKVNSAISVLMLALLLLDRAKKSGPRFPSWSLFGLLVPVVLGLSSVLEQLFNLNFGIDDILFMDPESEASGLAPGRMSAITAILILLSSAALFLKRLKRFPRVAEASSLASLTLALVGLYSYEFGVRAMYQFVLFESLSLNTVVSFLAINLGLVLVPPRSPSVDAVFGRKSGDQLGLRILIAVFALPMLVGSIALWGVRVDLYGQAFAMAILAAIASILTATWVAFCFRVRNQMGAAQDKVEAALREREDWFRVITENARELIMVADAEDRVVYVSPSFEELFHEAPETQLGRSLFDRWHPGDERDWQILGQEAQFAFRASRGPDFWLPMSGSARVVTIDGQIHRILIARDVEEWMKSEERLRRRSRLEAIGRVAGGVAHDFNNYLTVIQGCLELVNSSENANEETHELCQQALQVSQQAASMSRGLLTMGNGQFLCEETVDPEIVVNEMEPVFQHLMPKGVHLSVNLESHGLKVCADSARFRQVLMNLVVNARDAMLSGGEIQLEMSAAILDAIEARKHSVDPGNYLVIRVSDTGCGIPVEIQERMFEPFFTTKGRGKGTGLGLATVYGFVRDAQGSIDLVSEVGVGSTFLVYWPLTSRLSENALLS